MQREPSAYTPKHLADKILRSKSALEGERKQVTVLFADVKDSTELAGELDPEGWHRILDRFFEILTEGVHRFEGTVNQYTGDGIMALFGAPIAHEDHAQRACYAALHLRDELRCYADQVRLEHGLNFSTRMGLNSGEVVVGKIGDDLRMDYTAHGQIVNVAQRMEQLAEPGRVYLTQETAERVSGYFQLRAVGDTPVKGLRAPVRVHDLEGSGDFQSRFDVSRARGLSRFVGREREMAALEFALERAREGKLQMVGIVAEAGTGKSRLAYEFGERCRERGIEVHTASCVPHGKAIPLGLSLSVQRDFFGISDRDSPEAARDKIAAGLSRRDPALAEYIPFVMDLLGVAEPGQAAQVMDADARQQEFQRYSAALLKAVGGLVVMVLEDLHWIDAASQAAYLEIHRLERDVPRLRLLTFRPEYRPPESDWPGYEEIRLKPLSAQSTGELLDGLLGPDAAQHGLRDRIQERAAGNPFFAEEIVRALADSGALEGSRGAYRVARSVEEIEVPTSVHAVLAARIDGLDERAKLALQSASVIGASFPLVLVEAVAAVTPPELPALLSALAESGFLFQEAMYPELVYAFKHPLTREVAYETQLEESRRRAHARLAAALEEHYAGALDEKAALIAYHWERARDPLSAARWHNRAAAWIRYSDPGSAKDHWSQAKKLAASATDNDESRSLRLAAFEGLVQRGLLMDEAESRSFFEEGCALAEAADNLRSLARLHVGYAWHLFQTGHMERRLEVLESAERIVAKLDDSELTFTLIAQKALNYSITRGSGPSLRMHNAALELVTRDRSLIEQPWARGEYLAVLMRRAMAIARMGDLETGTRELEEMIEQARSSKDAQVEGVARSFAVHLAYFRGDAASAHRHALAAVQAAEASGSSPVTARFSLGSLGIAHMLDRRFEDALRALEEALPLSSEEAMRRPGQAGVWAALAEVHLALGNASEARTAAERALEAALQFPNRAEEIVPRLAYVRMLIATEGAAASREVEQRLEELSRLIETGEASLYTPFVLEERARLLVVQGEDKAAIRTLRDAHRLYREVGATGQAERLARELEAGA